MIATDARRRRLDDAAVTLALAAAATLFAFTGWAWRLERLVYDSALSLATRPPPADVVIVAIDDASLAAIGRWPWRRAVHATLLDRLAAARPKAVALDLVLSEPDPDPRQDALLAGAMARAAPVVLPLAWRPDAVTGLAALQPIEPLRRLARLGAAESSTDADGVLRHAFLHAGPADGPLPNLALALLQSGGDAPAPGLDVSDEPGLPGESSWRRRGRFAIRFIGPPGTVRRVSYVDVLSGAVPPAQLAGRYLLVGATAQGLGDRQPTPVDDGGTAMAGIEVLANVLQTLRGESRIAELGPAAVAMLSAIGLALLVPGLTRAGPRRALPLALMSLPVAIGAAALLLGVGVWCNPMPFALAALLAYPLWSWRRLERAMRGLDREIDHLRDTALPQRPRGDAIDARLQALRDAADVVREARQFTTDAIASLPTAMLVADASRRVTLANTRAAALFDVEGPDELVGLDLARLLHEFATPTPIDWPAALSAQRPGDAGIATEARLADTADLMLHVAALDLQAERRWVVSLADVGLIRQAEREREEALAFVSHDLRAPAGAIVLLADLHLDGALQTPRDELLRQVRRHADRTLALADAFVRASRAATQPLQRSRVRLADLVDEALEDLRPQAASHRIRIDARIADTTVDVDRFLLARAIANLVSNAIRHSPEGGIVRVVADGCRLQVDDEGPGLSPRQVADLRAGDGGTAVGSATGVGLGLLFVQRVARRHGGRLRLLESSPGRGARFEIEVPATRSGNP